MLTEPGLKGALRRAIDDAQALPPVVFQMSDAFFNLARVFGSRLPVHGLSPCGPWSADQSQRSCEGNRLRCRAGRRRTFHSLSCCTSRIRRQAGATLRCRCGAAIDFAWRTAFSLALDRRAQTGSNIREGTKGIDIWVHFNNRDRCSSAWRLCGHLPR